MRGARYLAALIVGACAGSPQPALLMPNDDAAMDRLRAVLAKEMGRVQVDLGPSDPARSPVISVLPLPSGPLNDRDLALPTKFRLEIEGQSCALVRQDTGARIALDGVSCRAASGQ